MIGLILLTFLAAVENEEQHPDQGLNLTQYGDFSPSPKTPIISPERPDNPNVRDPKMCDDGQNESDFQDKGELA